MIVPIRLKISYAFLIKSRQPILVDTGSPGEAPRIARALEREGIRLTDLGLLLHTHGHADHCGSTADLKLLIEAPVAVHAADAPKMRSGSNGTLHPTNLTGYLIMPFVNVPFGRVEPDILLKEGDSLADYGVAARVVSTPGHTAGSISVVFDDGRAITGDLLMGGILGGYVFPSMPGYHYYADDPGEVRRSIKKLLDLGVKQFFPGHGGPLDAAAVEKRFGNSFAATPRGA
jgi:glyoxylase-like metal-dependent hydrolase (beta-lactamase superfamily II)